MATTLSRFLKTPHAGLSAEEILRAPVDVLLGVSSDARATLEAVHIATVFDLAASQIFATATTLLQAETDPSLAEARLNVAAADAVDAPPGVPVGEWARRDLTLLAGLTAAQADALEDDLDVATIRDLALWPPYLAARDILQETFGLPRIKGDPEAPDDLRPTPGSYATERAFYRKLVIDVAPQADQTALPAEELTGIDLDGALASPAAAQRIATGALLTFKQSWFSHGVTLGQLLHSLALAPGESTRIAVVDWTRRTRASATESIDEREQLANEQSHIRALNEVTSATASEFQAGSSSTSTTSSTGQTGASLGLELGPFAFGGSHGGSSSTTEAMSASSSFGARDLAASLSQSINDRTQQNASSARGRRASAVREVSQSEHEEISTRVVTNYNHMHALTVQYYETVQAYRVTTALDRAERCLFVPLKLLDFRNTATVDRLRATLAETALTPATYRQLTSEYGAVEIIPQTPRVTIGTVGLADVLTSAVLTAPVATAATMPGTRTMRRLEGALDDAAAKAADIVAEAAPASTAIRFDQGPAAAPAAVVATKGWNLAQINLLATVTGLSLLRRESDSVFLPGDARLLGVALRDGQAARIAVRLRSGADAPARSSTATMLELAASAALSEVRNISIQNAQDRDVRTTLALSVSVDGSVVTLDVPVRVRSSAAVTGLQEVVRFGTLGPSPELVQHLETNRLHYSQAVFARLDEAAIAALLGRFTYKGMLLQRIVDPRPVATTGNYLVFRMNVPTNGDVEDGRFVEEQHEFAAFLKARGLDRPAPQSQIVPLPSEGVFAEAVLGRFNSAEKIDLGRFWNWQDSPIPITAPEIAAISAGSRAEAETLRPGQLGAPVVTIQQPTALPGAAGVGPMLSALQAQNLFRDMSGMEQTAALAQAAVQASGAGATSAGDQAAQNLKTVMEQHTERLQIAADMVGAMMNPAGAAASTASRRGAELNQAEKNDNKAPATTTTGGGTAGAGTTEGGTPGGTVPAAPPTLAQETLDRQTGTDTAKEAEAVVETATAPATPAKSTRRPARTGGSSTGGGAPPASTGTIAQGLLLPADTPVKYRVQILFRSVSGMGIWGLRQISVQRRGFFSGGTTIASETAVPGQDLFVAFETAEAGVAISLSALIVPGPYTSARKFIELPRPLFRFAGTQPAPFEVKLEARPTVHAKTFTIGTTGIFQPDTADLDQQLTQIGVLPSFRLGDPKFELQQPPISYKATVRWIGPELIVSKVL